MFNIRGSEIESYVNFVNDLKNESFDILHKAEYITVRIHHVEYDVNYVPSKIFLMRFEGTEVYIEYSLRSLFTNIGNFPDHLIAPVYDRSAITAYFNKYSKSKSKPNDLISRYNLIKIPR